jgi:ABC-type branched-subunit amino acid transport system substrate-binding protein
MSPRLFPPSLGWIPLGIALLALTSVGIIEVAPQYGTKVVGVTQAPVGGSSLAPGQTPGPGGGVHTTFVPGANNPNNPNGGGGPGGSGPGSGGGISCAGGHNGGATAPGVTATSIHIASTIVTTGVGAGFLGEAVNGMNAAIAEANSSGGVCGRGISLQTLNTGWDATTGNNDITNFAAQGNVFALVGEPDSEGLKGAIDAGTIDRAGIPVVGSDGMLADQYNRSPWVFPVAASTVTNMHIIAKYAVQTLKASSFGIVYDTAYKFGAEGASAFDQEIHRLTGHDIQGYNPSGGSCTGAYCGVSSQNQSYSSDISAFNGACNPCDVVVLLLEPGPAETWMKGEEPSGGSWYKHLFGGEPLFDDQFASTCGNDCANLVVWTGYHPSIQPFDGEAAVVRYVNSLHSVCPQGCDPQNEFTEGAYIGTRMFIEACKRVTTAGEPLTRENLRAALQGSPFDFNLSANSLHYGGLPHLANISMAAFSDNAQGSFNGWNYLQTGFIADPAPGQDLSGG